MQDFTKPQPADDGNSNKKPAKDWNNHSDKSAGNNNNDSNATNTNATNTNATNSKIILRNGKDTQISEEQAKFEAFSKAADLELQREELYKKIVQKEEAFAVLRDSAGTGKRGSAETAQLEAIEAEIEALGYQIYDLEEVIHELTYPYKKPRKPANTGSFLSWFPMVLIVPVFWINIFGNYAFGDIGFFIGAGLLLAYLITAVKQSGLMIIVFNAVAVAIFAILCVLNYFPISKQEKAIWGVQANIIRSGILDNHKYLFSTKSFYNNPVLEQYLGITRESDYESYQDMLEIREAQDDMYTVGVVDEPATEITDFMDTTNTDTTNMGATNTGTTNMDATNTGTTNDTESIDSIDSMNLTDVMDVISADSDPTPFAPYFIDKETENTAFRALRLMLVSMDNLHFSNSSFDTMKFEQVSSSNSTYQKHLFKNVSMDNAFFEHALFDHATFADCVLKNSIMQNTQFKSTLFWQTVLQSLHAHSVTFDACIFDNFTITDSSLFEISFANSYFIGSGFNNSHVSTLDFSNCTLDSLYFFGSSLTNVSFTDAIIEQLGLSSSTSLAQCDFTGATINTLLFKHKATIYLFTEATDPKENAGIAAAYAQLLFVLKNADNLDKATVKPAYILQDLAL